MARETIYTLGPDVPDTEAVRDSCGRLVDDAYVKEAVDGALGEVRGRGRPSLSEGGESPMLRVRLPRALDEAVRQAAQDAGTSRSDWVRRVLANATAKAR